MAEKKTNILLLCSNFFILVVSVSFLIWEQTIIQIINTSVVFILSIISLFCFVLEYQKTKNIKDNESLDNNTKKNIKKINFVRIAVAYLIMLSFFITILIMWLELF